MSEGRGIARQQQMFAVVDRHADRRVVIGAAAPAGEAGGLVHDDGFAAPGQIDRAREAGKAGANDVNRPRHQTSAYRSRARTTRARETWTGGRGALKPRATRR